MAGVFLSPDDARRTVIRNWYMDWLGREPEEAAIQGCMSLWAAKGGEAVLAAIFDSAEAKAFRARRGW